MEIKPIKRRQPSYPTLEYFAKNPSLLSKSIPASWLKNKYVATSLATFVLCGNISACKRTNPQSIVVADEFNKEKKPDSKQNSNQNLKKVAPVFVHGDGSGATGCIVMSPPVFISEDEALKIVFDALKAENVKFDTAKCPTFQFIAPAIANDCIGDATKIPKTKVKIRMDGYNTEYDLAIEYVSANDFSKFISNDGCFSSVQVYKTQKAAELIQAELKAHSKTNAVVFYDPITSINYDEKKDWEESKKEAKEEATKLLLAQVNDFIKWIKEEKIIVK